MVEDNHNKILHLCSLMYLRSQVEIKSQRAQYKVDYYRKIRKAIEMQNKDVISSKLYSKWANNPTDLSKKIEQARIEFLRASRDKSDSKKKLDGVINRLLKKTSSMTIFQDGKVIGLMVNSKTIAVSEFERLHQQYVTDKTMERLLKS